MRRMVIFVLLGMLLVSGSLAGAAADAPIRVLLNDRPLRFDVEPRIESGRVLVPMRAIFEALGATVGWDGARRAATAVRGDTVVYLRVGAGWAYVKSRGVVLDVPAVIRENRTLVPLRFVAEALGAKVDWDGGDRTVTISLLGPSPTPVTRPEDVPPPMLAGDKRECIQGKIGATVAGQIETGERRATDPEQEALRTCFGSGQPAGPGAGGPQPSPAFAGDPERYPESKVSPATSYPKPTAEGYFPGMDNPRVLASGSGIEVTGGGGNVVFQWPLDGELVRTLMVKNTGANEAMVDFQVSLAFAYDDGDAMINHPQPGKLYLRPGDSQAIVLRYQYGGDVQSSPAKSGDRLDAPLTVDLSISHPDDTGSPSRLQVLLPNTIVVAGFPGPRKRGPDWPSNATVSGTVVNGGTSSPVPDVEVFISDLNWQALNVRTDANGRFEAPVYAYRQTGTQRWHTFDIRAQVDRPEARSGEAWQTVQPAPGARVDVTVRLFSAPPRPEYRLVNTLDVGSVPYTMAASADGSVIAVVPFHSGESPLAVADKSFVTAVSSDGRLLFRYPIGGETPTVDVSRDGTLVATTLQPPPTGRDGRAWGGSAIVLDRTGKLVFRLDPPPVSHWFGTGTDLFSVVRLSHDNRYLAAGNGIGDLFLVDLASGKVLWTAFTGGQVRFLAFSPDGERLYADSGSGYLRAFNLQGTEVWQTYVDSWLTDMAVSERYILTTSKASSTAIHLLDRATGAVLWSYPTSARGRVVRIAPDESYVLFGTDQRYEHTSLVLSIEGLPLLDLSADIMANAAAISGDGGHILVGTPDRLAIYDRYGRKVWDYSHSGNLLWMAPDGSRFVVADQPSFASPWVNRASLLFFQGSLTPPQAVTVTVDNSGSNIELTRDQQLIVSLSSNRTTGYSWSLADPTTGILKAEGPPTYVTHPTNANVNVVGAGGTETWKFAPTGTGQQRLRFEYRRPWEQGALPARVVEYTVTVR